MKQQTLSEKGPTIKFLDKQGREWTGELSIVPGYELIDVVYVHKGFIYFEVYELATGISLVDSNAVDKLEAATTVVLAFLKKGITEQSILKKIYNAAKTSLTNDPFKQVNYSAKYEAYKAIQLAELESRPYLYTPEQQETVFQLIARAKQEGMSESYINMLTNAATQKKGQFNSPFDPLNLIKTFDWNLRRHRQRQYKIKGEPIPEEWRDEWHASDPSWEGMIAGLNSMRKRDNTMHIPNYILREFHEVWKIAKEKNQLWGYSRFAAHPWSMIARLAIDLKKNRDESDTIVEIQHIIRRTLQDIKNETQPYQLPPGE